jgi:hypothetical protein
MKWCQSKVFFEARYALHTELHSRKKPTQQGKFNFTSLLNAASIHLLSICYLTILCRCITDISRSSERSVIGDGTTVVPLTYVNTNSSKPTRLTFKSLEVSLCTTRCKNRKFYMVLALG